MNLKSMFSTLGLAISLTSFAGPGWSQESGVEGGSAGLDSISVSPPGWDNLASATVAIPNGNNIWHCVATCSAEVAHVSGPVSRGTLVIRRLIGGTMVTQTPSMRRFELINNPGINDPSPKEISTTLKMTTFEAGNHNLACAARRDSGDTYNVNRSTISVVCTDLHL